MPTLLDAPKTLTPMMAQYRAIKQTLPPDTILFFHLGDFYEMFFEDAVRASEILRITLTGRDAGEAGRAPMCGVPCHAFSRYVRLLLDHRLKVAICEQVADPKTSKGLLERKVTRIITPATFLDEDAKDSAPEYLVAVARDGSSAALACLDLGTGHFEVRALEPTRLRGELTLLAPREVILPRALAQDGALTHLVKDALHAGLSIYDDWVFELEEAERHLLDTFHLASARSLAVWDMPACARAAGAVVYYLKAHLHSTLSHLQPPRLLQASDVLILDAHTQSSLELTRSQGRLRDATLLSCVDRTRTPMGGRTILQWLTHPLRVMEPIARRHDAVQELAERADERRALRAALEGIRDLERLIGRLSAGVANARDLLALAQVLRRIPALTGALEACQGALVQELRDSLAPQADLCDVLEHAIVEDPPAVLTEGGMIREGHDPELDALRDVAAGGRAWIAAFERRESERTGIRSLRVKYSQVFGYAIEVSKPNLHLVPPEYSRKQTLVNAERFVVPELLDWDQKIAQAQARMKALEQELFQTLRRRVLERVAGLQQTAKAIGVLDALASLADVAVQKRWVRPELVAAPELLIRDGRHPVVEAMLPAGQFVANDTRLDTDDHQLLILTGPNMAGKSTYIRQVALIVILAQMGSFVPAASARIGLVDRIFTRIGASDNLAGGESTFMVEMIETAQILRDAAASSLVILDEVGRGTSTFDGVSIAWAVCEHLTQGPVRPRTLFATHYHELTQLETRCPGVKNYTMMVHDTGEEVVLLRKVARGGSDNSYGLHVARLAGLPEAVIRRAAEILAGYTDGPHPRPA